MSAIEWTPEHASRLAAIRDELAKVSTATATSLMVGFGWRNCYMTGLRPLEPLGLGRRLVGRARTCRYLMRRGPESSPDPQARRTSPEIVLIESIDPGDVFCVDALGVQTAGIIGDILTARMLARGVTAAIINGAVRDSPYIKTLGLPVYSATVHPAHSGRDLVPVDFDRPIDMAGVHVAAGDVLLADDEGVVAMPLDLAEQIASIGPGKEHLEEWIRGKIVAGGSVHDYYPPAPEKLADYERETGIRYRH
jgi:5-oxopent-3-ene-1,2,5-tricarboxylate decarboxylase/2-hydroxyhepta-2,4-diene-1,7-dioate isomerase